MADFKWISHFDYFRIVMALNRHRPCSIYFIQFFFLSFFFSVIRMASVRVEPITIRMCSEKCVNSSSSSSLPNFLLALPCARSHILHTSPTITKWFLFVSNLLFVKCCVVVLLFPFFYPRQNWNSIQKSGEERNKKKMVKKPAIHFVEFQLWKCPICNVYL